MVEEYNMDKIFNKIYSDIELRPQLYWLFNDNSSSNISDTIHSFHMLHVPWYLPFIAESDNFIFYSIRDTFRVIIPEILLEITLNDTEYMYGIIDVDKALKHV
jgi:hypothetical protein